MAICWPSLLYAIAGDFGASGAVQKFIPISYNYRIVCVYKPEQSVEKRSGRVSCEPCCSDSACTTQEQLKLDCNLLRNARLTPCGTNCVIVSRSTSLSPSTVLYCRTPAHTTCVMLYTLKTITCRPTAYQYLVIFNKTFGMGTFPIQYSCMLCNVLNIEYLVMTMI